MLLASAFKVQQHRHYLSLSSLAVTASKPKPYLLYPIAAAPVHTPHLLVIGSSDDSLQKLLHTLPDYTATPPGHEFGFSTLTMCKTILRNFLSRLRSQGRTQVPTNVCLFVLFLHSRLAETVSRYAQEYASLG